MGTYDSLDSKKWKLDKPLYSLNYAYDLMLTKPTDGWWRDVTFRQNVELHT